MINPEEEVTAVLAADRPISLYQSRSSAVLDTDAGWTAPLEGDQSEAPVQQLGQWALVWIRFRRHKVAMIGAAVLLVVGIIAVIGPYISPESYYGYNYTATNIAPEWNWRYLLGTDGNGHAIVMYILLGTRTSLMVGILSGLVTSVIGIILGAFAGFYGGWIDSLVMRVTDVFLTLPFLPLLILLSAFLAGGNMWFVIAIFGVLGWPTVARLIRAYYLTYRQQEFTEAARAAGVSDTRIIFRHIFPLSLSPVIVSFTLNVAGFIIGEAAIDFLQVGLRPPQVSLGIALAGSQQGFLENNWWWVVFPGITIVIIVLAVNFLGDGLRDALDVRAKANT